MTHRTGNKARLGCQMQVSRDYRLRIDYLIPHRRIATTARRQKNMLETVNTNVAISGDCSSDLCRSISKAGEGPEKWYPEQHRLGAFYHRKS